MNNMARIAKNILNKTESKSLSTPIHGESFRNQKQKFTCSCNYNQPDSQKRIHSAVNSCAYVG